MVNAQKLQGSWNRIKGQVKEHWGALTEDDLTFRQGNVDQLVGRIQQKTGEGREAIEKFLSDLIDSGSSFVSQAAQQVGQMSQQVGDRMREGMNFVSEHASDGYDQATGVVRRYPAQSVAAIFGVGVGIGLMFGLMLRGR
jgi:uncharacterized protein YjbJ (UPF0337 family)